MRYLRVCVTRHIVSVGHGVRERRVVKGSRAYLVIYNRACPPLPSTDTLDYALR